MRRLALAIALACVFSGAARAGEIPTTGAVAPPAEIHPTGKTTGVETPSTGATASEASDAALTIILTLISIVP